MRDALGALGLVIGIVLAVVLVVGMSWGGYLLYLRFVERPAITFHAQNVRHSLNFVQSANQRAELAMADYAADSTGGDVAHANADRMMACSAAATIDQSEMQPDVLAFVVAHCGGQ